MTTQEIGILGTLITFGLIVLGLPIGFSFALVGGLGICIIAGLGAGLDAFARITFTWASDYTYSCVPAFILMGLIIAKCRIASDLYVAGYKWLGRLPGGLAMSTLVSCGLFGAVCGSSAAGSATMSAICYPEMKKYRYREDMASACVAIGGTIAIMIPPSLAFIIFGILTETSIGALFIAGIIPGILEMAFYCLTVYAWVKRNPSIAPLSPTPFPLAEKLKSLLGVLPVIVLFLFILGGIYTGLFTPIEAGGSGATAAMVIGLIMRRLSFRLLIEALRETLRTTAMIFMLIMGAMVLNSFLTISGLSGLLGNWIKGFNLSPVELVTLLCILYLPLGMVMDTTAMLVLTIPLYTPLLQAMDVNLIWFGVLVVLCCEIGQVTPPMGLNVYITQGVIKEVPLEVIFRGAVPFVIAAIALVILLIAFPQLSIYLPSLMM